MSARAIAQALFRHRRKMAASMALCLGVGGAVAALAPPQWRAEAVLMVDASRSDGPWALAAMLESRDLHAQVLARLGGTLYPRLEAPYRAERFARDLTVERVENASLVRLSFDAIDGALATQALNAVLERLGEKNRAVFAPADAGGELVRQATEARDKLAAFRKKTGITDGTADKPAMERRRGELENELSAAGAETEAHADRLGLLKSRLAATPPNIEIANESERSKVAEDARAKLFELQTREAEALGKYQDTSVTVRNLQAEKRKVEELLAKLENTTQNRVTSGANPVYQDLEKEVFRTEAALSSAKARLKSGQRRMAELERRLDALNASERQLAELEQAANAADARLAAGRGGAGAAIAGIGLVESATAGVRPVGPSPLAAMGIAAVAGLLLSLLVAFLAQKFSSRIATPADVERRLGLPVLTTIPRES